MTKSILTAEISSNLSDLYQRMEENYDRVAVELDFTCTGCPDNCCDSYFQHHTIIEWAYLWEGLSDLSDQELARIRDLATDYLAQSQNSLMKGERPAGMCPLNDSGLCKMYHHRLMICRMHGVPSRFKKPDGNTMSFPGCFRCQELVADKEGGSVVDRTELYMQLASLERDVLIAVGYRGPRVKMTIAEMIISGAPKF